MKAAIQKSILVILVGLGVTAMAGDDNPAMISAELSGGETTVFDTTRDAFSLPAHNITAEHRPAFFVGNSFFNEVWVAAPSSTPSRDGLGPLFMARSCSACHFKDGRSAPPEQGKEFEKMVLRLSVPWTNGNCAPVPEPVYGGQLQTHALTGIRAEADVVTDYQEVKVVFGDGEAYALRRPTFTITNLGYGHMAGGVMTSTRVSPAVIGLGLLEAVPEETLRKMADAKDRNGDGISGKLNLVRDEVAGKNVIGRFGWKAEQPNVAQQVAGAFLEDMGLSTPIFAGANHTPAEKECAAAADGGSPEVNEEIFKAVVIYSRTLAVPARRNVDDPVVRRGEALFRQLNCTGCHTAELRTRDWPEFPELSQQTIHPYTDLLLHDMGAGLADGRPVFEATGSEWRTPPLWGIGLVAKVNGHTCFLHDGRARNLSEALLWHGGEAEKAKEGFRTLPKPEREALIKFLESL